MPRPSWRPKLMGVFTALTSSEFQNRPSSQRRRPCRTSLGAELIIGTYTEKLPHVDGKAEGILSCSFDGTNLSRPRVRWRIRETRPTLCSTVTGEGFTR